MKRILFFLIATIVTLQTSAQVYLPSYGTQMQRPVGISLAAPTDARSYFYNTSGFNFRMYNSTAEILSWLNNSTKRSGHILYFVNVGGRAVPYWFNGGFEDSNLEPFFKPVNDAIALKENTISTGTTGQYFRGDKQWSTLDKSAVGLGNVLNVDQTNANNIITGSVKVLNGGTGLTSIGTTGQLMRVNAAATGLEYFTLPNYLLANQQITFSGDVTGSGSTTVNLTISNNAVTFAKFQNIPTQTLLGRYSASTGLLQSITLGTNMSLSASGVLSSSGGFTEEQIIAILEANTQKVKGKNGFLFDPSDTSLVFVPENILEGNIPLAVMPVEGISGSFTNANVTIQNGLVTSAANGTGGTGNVTSVFNRTGAVAALLGDYSAFYASLTGNYANPGWIASLDAGKLTGSVADARLSSNVTTNTGTQTLTNKTLTNPKIAVTGAVVGDLFYVNANNELVRVGGSTAEGAFVRRVGGLPTWVEVGEPIITTASSSLTGFNTNPGTASSSQSSTVGGLNLTANMTATLTTADGFEFSSNGSTWVTTPITITQSGGIGNGTLHARLSSSASLGSRSGLITITSAGAPNKTITLTGTVAALASTITTTVSTLTGFSTPEGTASTAQSFTVSGADLAANITGTLTTSDGFEISLDGSSWQTTPLTINQSDGTASSTFYARLASTAGVGSRSGLVTFTSTGAANKTVTLSGTVTAVAPDARILIDLGGNGVGDGVGYDDTGIMTPNNSNRVGADGTGKYWNNITTGLPGIILPRTVDINNVEIPGMTFATDKNPAGTFSPNGDSAMNFIGYVGAVGEYPANATIDNMYFHSSAGLVTMTIVVPAGKKASIKFWGSRTTTGTARILQIRKLGEPTWQEFNSLNNSDYATSATVSDLSGTAQIQLQVKSGSSFGHISVMDIELTDL